MLVDKEGNEVDVGGEGLLLYNGGTVCDDDFDDNAADAICKFMGYDEASRWTSGNTYDIQKRFEIRLDDVKCRNDDWLSCEYMEWSKKCAHEEDVFLSCTRGNLVTFFNT